MFITTEPEDVVKIILRDASRRREMNYINREKAQEDPRMMLLMGMNTSLITYPITPIIASPTRHAFSILKYSVIKLTSTIFGRLRADL